MKKLKRLFFIIFIIILAISAYFIEDGYMMYKNAIEKTPIKEKVASLQEDEDYVKIDEISEYLQKATVDIEDKRFYEHFGIDLYSIGRAFVSNFESKEITGGGSTITQQLVKNLYFDQSKRITRKVAEVFFALDFEEQYEKDEILELYLNVIYYGDGYYGIGDACSGYFDKTPDELDLNEASLLAGIPNAPSVYAISNNSIKTYQRQKMVLRAMLDNDDIDKEEYDEILNIILEKEGI